MNDTLVERGKQASGEIAAQLGEQVARFVGELIGELDRQLDQRLVRTFLRTILVIIQFRHRANGLLLSELGAYLGSPDQAPAGTKRLSTLLRSARWQAAQIEQFLWRQADERLAELEAAGEMALAVWDSSVLEKPESLEAEGLGPVRSSKAKRLTRIKPGYYRPPERPIFVPGMQWFGLLLVGLRGAPTLAALRWWTSRGKFASDKRTQEEQLWRESVERWGQRVWHIFDRGFAGMPWVGRLLATHSRWIMRWPKGYHLLDVEGRKRPAWQIARGKRAWATYHLWDARRRTERTVSVLAVPVFHPAHPEHPLWLIVSRRKKLAPWYLLSPAPIESADDLWRVVRAYARRWQIEMMWRFSKSELAFESPRLWRWEGRLKLLLIATLAFAFLLSLLKATQAPLREWLLRFWCHRTGKRSREVSTPLYRLRSALSRLWLAFPPYSAIPLLRNSG